MNVIYRWKDIQINTYNTKVHEWNRWKSKVLPGGGVDPGAVVAVVLGVDFALFPTGTDFRAAFYVDLT